MAYSDFTFPVVVSRFGLSVDSATNLFESVPEADLPPGLADRLTRYLPLALVPSTEKARSELLIAPVLAEFTLLHPDRVGFFSGTTFDVDPEAGLNGRCDYILTRNPLQFAITAPI
ncbi:MAG: hypothetical protein ACRC33_07570, partial [Gemmataceae bacterium]